MDDFMLGAVAMACFVAGLFFLRFWKETRDRLFVTFAVAFWILGATRIVLAVSPELSEQPARIYLFRLLAYLLILISIVDKNLSSTKRSDRI